MYCNVSQFLYTSFDIIDYLGQIFLHLHFSHLADAFIQSDLQIMTMEAIKIKKRAMIYKSQLA